jgi:Protein of unknown function (DUF1761)
MWFNACRGKNMVRVNFVALTIVVFVAFIASSLWYSPLLFGREFLELSGFSVVPKPSALRAICELFRTFVLGYVIARFVSLLGIKSWKRALTFGLWLWIGFPVILLTGSILWQNAPWKLAAIHSGDWLVKLILIPVAMTLWPKRTNASLAD